MLLNPLRSTVQVRAGLPILPGSFPGVGHLPAFFSEAPALISQGRQRLGPLFWMHMGPGLGWHLTCCGAECFDLLKSKAVSNAHLAETHPQFISKRGLMALEGTAHHRLRSLMNAAFSPRGLSQHGAGPVCGCVLGTMIDGWAERGAVKVLPDTQRAALDVIFRMLDVPREELGLWYQRYRQFAWSTLPMPILDQLVVKPATEWLHEKLQALAEGAQRRPAGSSMLTVLAHAKDEEGKQLSVDDLVDNMRLLAFAGHDTSASAMAWAVIELARAPELWERLVSEARQRPHVPQSPQEVKEHPFAEALFREAVRLHPPVPIYSRRTVQPLTFAGHQMPEGTVIYVPVIDFSLDSTVFPDPERYNPDRWLGRSGPPSPIETAAFGGGNHFCLGYHFAMLEGVLLLVLLAQRLSERGMRPRLPPGTVPQSHYLPLSHPAPGTVVLFTTSD